MTLIARCWLPMLRLTLLSFARGCALHKGKLHSADTHTLVEQALARLDEWRITMDATTAGLFVLALLAGGAQGQTQGLSLYEQIKKRGLANLVNYTNVINHLARAEELRAAMAQLDEGTRAGVRWDDNALCVVLVECGKAKDLASGLRVHQIAQQHNIGQSVHYLSSLLDMYVRCGELQRAEVLFAEMKQRNIANDVTQNIMISGLANATTKTNDANTRQHHRVKDARVLFDDLRKRGQASLQSYIIMVNALARSGDLQSAVALLDEGTAAGVRLDAQAFSALLVEWIARRA